MMAGVLSFEFVFLQAMNKTVSYGDLHHSFHSHIYRDEVAFDVPLVKILADLGSVIDREDSFRLNVNRAAVWDCALRAFNRSSFSPCKRLSIHFTDSVGMMEGAVDEGGPRREFLRLLSKALQRSMVFDGQQERRVLSMNSQGMIYFNKNPMVQLSPFSSTVCCLYTILYTAENMVYYIFQN